MALLRYLLPRTTLALALLLAAAPLPAAGADLSTLRSEAQVVADEITALEHRLARLDRTALRLEDAIAAASASIGVEELRLQEAGQAAAEARARFVAHAVEAYKGASVTRLELILSASTLSQLVSVSDAMAAIANADADALEVYLESHEAAASRQAGLDQHKQVLLRDMAEVEAIGTRVAAAIAERRSTVRELGRRIERLEEQIRSAVLADPGLAGDLRGSGPTIGIPDGFIGTGVTFEGIASWYGPGFEGNTTANGEIFDSRLFTAASKELPFGTWLLVEHEGRGVVVRINDRGPYVGDRILDLSHAAAEAIGISGLGWIRAEILIEK